MRQYEGKLSETDGWAVPRSARLSIAPEGVRVDADDGCRVEGAWTDLALKSSLSFERGVVVAGRAAGQTAWTFETADPRILQPLQQAAPEALARQAAYLARAIGTHQRRTARAVGWMVGLLAAVVGGFLWSVRAIPGWMASHVPLAWEETLGKGSVDSLLKGETPLERGPAYEAVHTVWKRIEPALPASPYTFRISIVESPVVNAFATPGGQIVVYTGLLDAVDGPEALAGILAHETAHVTRRHGLQTLIGNAWWSLGVGAIWSMFGGSAEKTMAELRQEVAALQSLAHSRAHERESDLDSLRTLARAGVDPQPFIRFFDRLGQGEKRPLAIFSTHPPGEDRAAVLRAFASTLPATRVTPIPVAWRLVRRDLLLRAHDSPASNP